MCGGLRLPYRKASTAVIVCPSFVNGIHLLREFSRRGAYTVAADPDAGSLGFKSRCAREHMVLPDPREAPGALSEILLGREDLYGGIVVPSDDYYVREIHRHYDELSRHYKLAVSPGESTAIALHKEAAYEAASQVGLEIPVTIEVADEDSLAAAAERTGLPAILRSSFSLEFGREFGRKNFPITNLDEGHRRLVQALASGHRMLLQEIIPGPDRHLVNCRGYVHDSGELSPVMCSSKRLQHPPVFGIGNVHESLHLPKIEEMTITLVRHLGYRGAIFGSEFKYDERTGTFKFIELNCRSLMSTGFSKYSGLNLVDYLWCDKMGLPQPSAPRIRLNRRWTYIKDALLRHKGYVEHRQSLREYWRLYRPPIGLALFDACDLRPFLHDLKPMLLRRLKK